MSASPLEGRAARIQADLFARPDIEPYLREPAYARVIDAWAQAEARVELYREYLNERFSLTQAVEHLDGTSPLTPARERKLLRGLTALHKSVTRAANMRSALGIRKH